MASDENSWHELKYQALDDFNRGIREMTDALKKLDTSDPSASFVDAYSRALHSLKGNARIAGFEEIAVIAHRYEDLIARLKQKHLELGQEVVDALQSFPKGMDEAVVDLEENIDAKLDFRALETLLASALKALSTGIVPKPKIDGMESASIFDAIKAEKQRVLLIDDEEDILDIHAELIEEILWSKPHCCTRAKDALDACKNVAFDFIITDFKMPEMNGLEFIETLRSDESSPSQNTPIIIITAFEPDISQTAARFEDIFSIEKPTKLKKLSFYLKCAARVRGNDSLP